MPILVQTIVDRMKQSIDGEGSDRYLFDQDYKPAINKGIEIMTSVFNKAFAENKLTPEALRELVKTKVWQLNSYSRFAYKKADTGHDLWTVLAMYPKPVLNKGVGSSAVSSNFQSKYRDDISFIKSKYAAKRLTFEEWNENVNNAFMPGNELIKGELSEYAYLDASDYTSKSYDASSGQNEFQIRPDIPGELIAMTYLKRPTVVTAIGDSIEFPESLTEMITEMSLSYIAQKQGDNTTLYQVTAQAINSLVNLMR